MNNVSNITITNIKTGENLSIDGSDWAFLAGAYMTGFDMITAYFIDHFDSWTSEFKKTHTLPCNPEEYDRFIIERWQNIVDQINDATARMNTPTRFSLEKYDIVMFYGDDYKVEPNL